MATVGHHPGVALGMSISLCRALCQHFLSTSHFILQLARHSDDTLQVGRERPWLKAPSVVELSLGARLQPWQQAAPGTCRPESQKQMHRQRTRGNSSQEACRLRLARPQTPPPHQPATSQSGPAAG